MKHTSLEHTHAICVYRGFFRNSVFSTLVACENVSLYVLSDMFGRKLYSRVTKHPPEVFSVYSLPAKIHNERRESLKPCDRFTGAEVEILFKILESQFATQSASLMLENNPNEYCAKMKTIRRLPLQKLCELLTEGEPDDNKLTLSTCFLGPEEAASRLNEIRRLREYIASLFQGVQDCFKDESWTNLAQLAAKRPELFIANNQQFWESNELKDAVYSFIERGVLCICRQIRGLAPCVVDHIFWAFGKRVVFLLPTNGAEFHMRIPELPGVDHKLRYHLVVLLQLLPPAGNVDGLKEDIRACYRYLKLLKQRIEGSASLQARSSSNQNDITMDFSNMICKDLLRYSGYQYTEWLKLLDASQSELSDLSSVPSSNLSFKLGLRTFPGIPRDIQQYFPKNRSRFILTQPESEYQNSISQIQPLRNSKKSRETGGSLNPKKQLKDKWDLDAYMSFLTNIAEPQWLPMFVTETTTQTQLLVSYVKHDDDLFLRIVQYKPSSTGSVLTVRDGMVGSVPISELKQTSKRCPKTDASVTVRGNDGAIPINIADYVCILPLNGESASFVFIAEDNFGCLNKLSRSSSSFCIYDVKLWTGFWTKQGWGRLGLESTRFAITQSSERGRILSIGNGNGDLVVLKENTKPDRVRAGWLFHSGSKLVAVNCSDQVEFEAFHVFLMGCVSNDGIAHTSRFRLFYRVADEDFWVAYDGLDTGVAVLLPVQSSSTGSTTDQGRVRYVDSKHLCEESIPSEAVLESPRDNRQLFMILEKFIGSCGDYEKIIQVGKMRVNVVKGIETYPAVVVSRLPHDVITSLSQMMRLPSEEAAAMSLDNCYKRGPRLIAESLRNAGKTVYLEEREIKTLLELVRFFLGLKPRFQDDQPVLKRLENALTGRKRVRGDELEAALTSESCGHKATRLSDYILMLDDATAHL